MSERPYDVIVIGAGMAGLTAARALAEAGLRVVVLEARDRVGGRIFTRHLDGNAIELGAEFIHGKPPELWALIDEIGLVTYEREGSQVCFEGSALAECSDETEHAFDPLERLKSLDGPDMSFADYLDREQIPPQARDRIIGYVEGFNAADYREISAASLGTQQRAEDAIGSDRNYSLRGGYDQLPRYLAERIKAGGGSIRTSTLVTEIRWSLRQAEIRTVSGSFHAPKCIVTLPLAVLQRGSVPIFPAPAGVLSAAAQLRMGQVRRFTLLFRERFWDTLPPQPALRDLSFLFAFGEMPPVWWTPHPEVSRTITGWVGGPRSAALANLPADELAETACAALARIFSMEQEHISTLLLGCYTHDWEHDPFALGAYSYVAAGGLNASRAMTIPLEDTLFFAGEHTDITGHWGTVHAAMRSGLRAASQLLGERNLSSSQ